MCDAWYRKISGSEQAVQNRANKNSRDSSYRSAERNLDDDNKTTTEVCKVPLTQGDLDPDLLPSAGASEPPGTASSRPAYAKSHFSLATNAKLWLLPLQAEVGPTRPWKAFHDTLTQGCHRSVNVTGKHWNLFKSKLIFIKYRTSKAYHYTISTTQIKF